MLRALGRAYMATLMNQLFWREVREAQEAELGIDVSPVSDHYHAMCCILSHHAPPEGTAVVVHRSAGL